MNNEPDTVADYGQLNEASGWVDVSERTLLQLTGDDRFVFLHNMCTNEIKALQVGQGTELFLTTVQGKVLAYGFAHNRSNDILLDTSAGQASAMIAHLDRYVIREDVALQEAELSCLVVTGQASTQVLADVAGIPLPEEPLANAEGQFAGATITICRYPFTHWPTYCILLPPEVLPAFAEQLTEAGCHRCPLEVWEALRVEAGVPEYGRDIDETNLPQEVGRDAEAISFVKGCYLGQETVARIDALGHVNRMLVGVELAGGEMHPGDEFLVEQKPVGRLTSVAVSPRTGKAIGLATVKRGFHECGTVLTSAHGTAEVCRSPAQ